MRRTLLSMTQSILSDMDSEGVNSISDTVEAMQVASVIEDTFYNIIIARDIPEHRQLVKLVSLSDNTRPTHFTYPSNTRKLEEIRYNTSTSSISQYSLVHFVEPDVFLDRMSDSANNVMSVLDVNSGTKLFIRTDVAPTYYTSFDDDRIVMNSYDASVESSLKTSKTRAFGYIIPTFSQTDDFEPDLDDVMLPYLLAEAKSTCFSLFKSGVDPKVDQAARRLKSYVQNDMYKTKKENQRPKYGRR